MRVFALELDNNIKGVERRKEYIEKLISQLPSPDFVVLPELALCSYMASREIWQYADDCGADTGAWAVSIAEKYHTYMGVGFLDKENGDYFNRYLIADEKQVYGTVTKSEGESAAFKRGDFGSIINTPIGNIGVDIFRYVTEATFDAYLYQTIENKQRFISQIMTSKSPVRSCEDADETTLSYAEVKALCAGNPLIKEKMDLDIDVAKLKVLKANHTSQQYRLEDKVRKDFPEMISKTEQRIKGYESDIKHLSTLRDVEEGISPMSVNGKTFTEKEEAGAALIAACKSIDKGQTVNIGNYKGFDMLLRYDPLNQAFCLDLKRELTYSLLLGQSESGNITRIDNALASIEKLLVSGKEQLETLHQQLENAKAELGKPFSQEQELIEKSARLAQLNAELNMDDGKDEKSAEQSENAKEEEIKKPEIAPGKAVDANTPKKPSVYGEIAKIKEEQQAKTATAEEKQLEKTKDSSIG